MKKIFSAFLLSISFLAFALEPVKSGDSLKDSADLANRRTALRCLSNATNYASEKNFDAALSQANLGIAYDDSISDLWYVAAAADSALGKSKAEVLPLLDLSLQKNNWVNYNRDNARLMAADILSETGSLEKALELLDSKPMIYSSDAEFIRCKIYYRMGTPESISTARNKIDGARRIYPSDTRFPLVFYRFENPEKLDAGAKRLSDYFISKIAQYQEASPDKDAELEIYAASFADGEVKNRMLKSFSARGLSHALYAQEALASGLIDQQHAFEYICSFAEKEVDLGLFINLLSKIDDENVLKYAADYMESFNGTFTQDTDGDGNVNLFVKYMRGRPQTISYDKNQDGRLEWSVDCDFGVPVSGSLSEKNMAFQWSQFPYLGSLSFNAGFNSADIASADKKKPASERFTFSGESLKWTPVLIESVKAIQEKTGKDFYFPVLNIDKGEISNSLLLDAASAFEIESFDDRNEKISFVLLDGNVTQALYYRDNVLFAQAQFEGNIPVLRVVDFDGDGVFETTEFYDLDVSGQMKVHSLEDERQIMASLYGVPSNGAEFYLRMVQIDTDKDTVPDFTEEYIAGGGKITSWDTDSDGLWNVRHVVYSESEDGIKEDSMFYINPDKTLVTVSSLNGVPVNVSCGQKHYAVVHGAADNLYWLLKESDKLNKKRMDLLEGKILKVLDERNVQGLTEVVEDNYGSALCIRIENNVYAIPAEDVIWTENEKK